MKNKKQIVLFLALIALAIFIGGSVYSFAKYFTSTDNSLGTSIKRWDIVVNNETIRNKTTLTNNITADFPNVNGHTAEDNIAPGVEGDLNITIDYTNVDVSFRYDLSIARNETLPDIELSDVDVTGGTAEDLQINRVPSPALSGSGLFGAPDIIFGAPETSGGSSINLYGEITPIT